MERFSCIHLYQQRLEVMAASASGVGCASGCEEVPKLRDFVVAMGIGLIIGLSLLRWLLQR